MMSNAPNASGTERDLDAPGDRGVDLAVPDGAQRLADGHRAAGARVRRREDGPADVEGDPEVGRRGAAEHRKRERRRDGLDAAFEVALVLRFGERDATQCAAEIDADALRVGGATLTRLECGVLHRAATSRQAELAEPVEGPSGPRVHVVERVEVVDLSSDARPERRWVEAVDGLDRRPTGEHARPERVAAADGRQHAHAGDDDAAPHVGGFVREDSVDVSFTGGVVATASASALNVASVGRRWGA